MAKTLPIHILGDNILRKTLKEVNINDPFLKGFIPDLIKTMYERDGVGLAANQVGVDLRIFVIDPYWAQEDGKKNPIVMINPEIHSFRGEQIAEEGCISLPGIYAKVPRALSIEYSYYNLDGHKISANAESYEAIVIQHEFDHLNGVVFTDRVSTLAKLKLSRKLKEMQAKAVNGVNIASDKE